MQEGRPSIDAALEWDPATLDLDADVAAIARWAAAHEATGETAEDAAEDVEESGALSGPTDSASDSSAPTKATDRKRPQREDAPRKRRVRKPRKSTYVAQKELKSSLTDEIRVLEARLELLRVRAGLPSRADRRSVASVQAANFELEEAIHANLLDVARFHSMISSHMHSISVGPISTHIRLSVDAAERRATLRAMRTMKLRRAQEMMENRMQHIDNTKPYVTEERYFDDDGTFHCKRFEVLPLEGARDTAQAFAALLGFLGNMAPNLTHQARGAAVVREDYEVVDPSIWLRRLVAEFGAYEQELHSVGFAQLFAPSERLKDSQPFGIVAVDSIDEDELHPFRPRERVRKDVTASISVRAEVAAKGPPRRLVVLRKSTFLTLHEPAFALAPAAREHIHAHMTDWCRAMNAALSEALPPPAVTASTN